MKLRILRYEIEISVNLCFCANTVTHHGGLFHLASQAKSPLLARCKLYAYCLLHSKYQDDFFGPQAIYCKENKEKLVNVSIMLVANYFNLLFR